MDASLVDPSGRSDVASLTSERAKTVGRIDNPSHVGSLTPARTGEAPGAVMKPLADPISPAESLALANRLIEPYLHDPMENDERKGQALRSRRKVSRHAVRGLFYVRRVRAPSAAPRLCL